MVPGVAVDRIGTIYNSWKLAGITSLIQLQSEQLEATTIPA